MRLNRAAAGLIAGILLIGLTGCGDDTPKPSTEAAPTAPTSSATQTPEPTATPTPVTDEDQAVAALLAYLEVRDETYRTLKVPRDLNKYVTDSTFYTLQNNVRALKQAGATYRGEYRHEVISVKREKNTGFVVSNCEDRTDLDARLGNGKPIKFNTPSGAAQPIRSRINYRVVPEGDRWVVDGLALGTYPPC